MWESKDNKVIHELNLSVTWLIEGEWRELMHEVAQAY